MSWHREGRAAVDSMLGAHDAGSFGENPVVAFPETVKRLAHGVMLGDSNRRRGGWPR